MITTLLKAGADIKAHHNLGGTALIVAPQGDNPDVVMVLLKAGADTKAKDNAGFAAHDYAKHNHNLKGTDALSQLEKASK